MNLKQNIQHPQTKKQRNIIKKLLKTSSKEKILEATRKKKTLDAGIQK